MIPFNCDSLSLRSNQASQSIQNLKNLEKAGRN